MIRKSFKKLDIALNHNNSKQWSSGLCAFGFVPEHGDAWLKRSADIGRYFVALLTPRDRGEFHIS